MIKILEKFNNGIKDCYKIYSDMYVKIRNKTNNRTYNATPEFPLVVIASEVGKYEETDIRISTRED